MKFKYTDTEVKILPFDDHIHAYITVHKPYMEGDRRKEARVTWSRFSQQFSIRAYNFSQALFVAAGLADIFNLTDDMEAIRRFGQ